MTWVLVRKLLRDVRVAWLVVTILLFLFQILWARITMRVTTQILAAFEQRGFSPELLMQILDDLVRMFALSIRVHHDDTTLPD